MNYVILAAISVVLATSPATAAEAAGNRITGTWINPHDSVAVEIAPCSEKLCGRVIWASEDALADARDGGVEKLLGTELLENYTPRSDNAWAGHVYVPDLGGHFASTITPVGSDALEIRGCMLGGLICKTQVWRRFTGRLGS